MEAGCADQVPESARPLWDLIATFSGSLSPTAVCADIDEAMDVAGSLTRDQARRELRLWFGDNSAAVPALLRNAAEGDHDAAQYVMRAFYGAYTAILRPHWPAIRAGHHTELVHHGRLLARQGTVGMLTNLVPGARWRDACLEIDTPRHREIRLRGGAWRWRRPTSGRGRRCSPISPTSRS
jgi:hypothetical protein